MEGRRGAGYTSDTAAGKAAAAEVYLSPERGYRVKGCFRLLEGCRRLPAKFSLVTLINSSFDSDSSTPPPLSATAPPHHTTPHHTSFPRRDLSSLATGERTNSPALRFCIPLFFLFFFFRPPLVSFTPPYPHLSLLSSRCLFFSSSSPAAPRAMTEQRAIQLYNM